MSAPTRTSIPTLDAPARGRLPGLDPATYAGQANPDRVGDAIVVDLPDRLLGFEPGSIELSQAGYDELDSLLAWLATADAVKIDVAGHASSEGSDNDRLSLGRAAAVAEYLHAKRPDLSLRIHGCGDRYPVDSNTTAAGRAVNRRVTVSIQWTVRPAPAEPCASDTG